MIRITKILEELDVNSEESWLNTEAKLMGELLNPDHDTFDYSGSKGLYTYKDSSDNLFFVRCAYYPTRDKQFFEFKTGWFEDNDVKKPKYEPALPPNVTAKDGNRRSNTVAKIYRDEIIPLFLKQDLSKLMIIDPVSSSRFHFAIRLVKKLTPKNIKIETEGNKILLTKE